jgi:Tol biopolymer transport system component
MKVPTNISAALLVLVLIALTGGVDRARAAFPGEDGLIAFNRTLKNDTGGFADRIVTVRKNGGDVNAITPRCCQIDEGPAWSPDGERIAFGHFPPGGRIVTMNQRGGSRERVTSGKRFDGKRFADSDPSWSPDGTEIAFFRQQGSGLVVGKGFDLFVVDVDGSNLRPIVTTDLDEVEPAWSPDGEWIAFVAQGVGAPGLPGGIYRMRPDGSDRQLVLELRDLRSGLDWSPDGESLAFSTRAEGKGPEIFTVRADGSDLTRLTNETRPAFDPAFSPQGDRIVYTAGGVLKVMGSSGGDSRQLLERSRGVGDFAPSWQPE